MDRTIVHGRSVDAEWDDADPLGVDPVRDAIIRRCLRRAMHYVRFSKCELEAPSEESQPALREVLRRVQEGEIVHRHDERPGSRRDRESGGVHDVDGPSRTLDPRSPQPVPRLVEGEPRQRQLFDTDGRLPLAGGRTRVASRYADGLRARRCIEGACHAYRGNGGAPWDPMPALFERQRDSNSFRHVEILPRTRFAAPYDCSVDLTNKRVLLTGGSGFLGKAIARRLERRGVASITIPRRADHDLTRLEDVEKVYAEASPDLVIHLAAKVGGIGANRAIPADIYVQNILMGTLVIEEARRRDVQKTIIAGTICAYPKFAPVPFSEESLWDGYPEETNAPYGIAKKALLVHAQANRQQYGQNVVYLLPVNLYGPGDKFHPSVSHVIPALIKKFVDAKEAGADRVEAWGTGRATREFLYVEDCADGFLRAAERYDGADPVNLGSGREISIKDLSELIATLVGFEGEIVWDTSKPDGQPRRQLDVTRAKRLLDFEAKTGLEDGLRKTIDWYVANRQEAEAVTL